eukprot:UN22756
MGQKCLRIRQIQALKCSHHICFSSTPVEICIPLVGWLKSFRKVESEIFWLADSRIFGKWNVESEIFQYGK